MTSEFRFRDIRHCFANIYLAKKVLGYKHRVSLYEGLAELACRLDEQRAIDLWEEAGNQLRCRAWGRLVPSIEASPSIFLGH